MALHEEAVRDRSTGGHYADLAGYHVATHADTPAIEVDWVDGHDPEDPVGIKGVGEIGIVARRRPSPTRSGTPPAYATGICRSAPTGSSPRPGGVPPGSGGCLTSPVSCTDG